MKIFLLFFLPFFVLSQQGYNVAFYNIDSKPDLNNIVDIASDGENCIVATRNKLYDFDGLNFIEISYKREKSNFIKRIFLYRDSVFLILEKGIIEINIINGQSKTLSNDRIFDVFKDDHKLILLKNRYTIEIHHGENEKTEKISYFNKYWNNPEDVNARIILYGKNIFTSIPRVGLYKYSDGHFTKYNNILPESYKENFKMEKGHLFFLGLKKVFAFNEEKDQFEAVEISKEKDSRIIVDFVEFRGKKLYIKNEKFLKVLHKNTISEITLSSDNNIELKKLSVFNDGVLISSNKGLFVLSEKNFFIHSLTNELRDKSKFRTRRKILKSDNQLFLFGNPYPIVIDQYNRVKENKYNGYDISVYDAAASSKGFYIGTEGLGLLFAKHSLHHYEKVNLGLYGNKSNITSVFYDDKDQRIICGDDKNLYSFIERKKDEVDFFPVPYSGYATKVITRDLLKSRYYIGSDNGLYVFQDGIFYPVKTHGKKIGDLYVDYKTDVIWVGHDEGIDVINRNNLQLKRHISLDFLNAPIVTAIIKDNFGYFWLSTFSGLVCLDPKGRICAFLTKRNGLINSEYNYKASFLDNKVAVFGGIDGYDFINTEEFHKQDRKNDNPIIKKIALVGKDTVFIKNNKGIEFLKFNKDNYFPRIFVCSNTSSATSTFEYKINDDKIWRNLSGNNYIDLVGYESGDYTLTVKEMTVRGNEVLYKPLNLKATENFYKSRWFLSSIIALTALLIFSLAYLRLYNKYKIDTIYKDISMDLHDDIGSQMSKISILLSSDTKMEAKHKNTILSNLDKAQSSLRMYLNVMKYKEIKAAELYNEIATMFLEVLYIRNIAFLHQFSTSKNVLVNSRLAKDIKLCCSELANNISKYSGTDAVRMDFKTYNDSLFISILSNEDYKLLNGSVNTGSFGLKNINERTERHNGYFKIINKGGKLGFEMFFHFK